MVGQSTVKEGKCESKVTEMTGGQVEKMNLYGEFLTYNATSIAGLYPRNSMLKATS